MSKTTGKEQAAPAQPDQGSFPLTLDEFCKQLSTSDKRVAMIGGFYATEKAARNVKDTAAAYQARYEKFIKQPA